MKAIKENNKSFEEIKHIGENTGRCQGTGPGAKQNRYQDSF